MINFKDIAQDFFKSMDVKVIHCSSDLEARQRMATRIDKDTYPVYFFKSDTSGEKLYEEFYTEEDIIELDIFKSLGVIKNVSIPSQKTIQSCLSSLKTLMEDPYYTKESIIAVMKQFIPDFDHIETGKNLDQKM